MRLLLLRHAETVWNALGRIQGTSDPALSDAGREQAMRLGARLQGTHLDAIYSSDLERARETATAVASPQRHHPPVRIMPGLREVGLGAWEGHTRDQLAAGWPAEYARWLAEPSWDIAPGGEGVAAFRARIDAALAEVIAAGRHNGTVAVVTHIGCIRLVLARLFGLSPQGPWVVQNTSITTVDVPPGAVFSRSPALTVLGVNDTAHLRSTGR